MVIHLFPTMMDCARPTRPAKFNPLSFPDKSKLLFPMELHSLFLERFGMMTYLVFTIGVNFAMQ